MSVSMARSLMTLVFALGIFSIARAKAPSTASQTSGISQAAKARPWMKCVANVQVSMNANSGASLGGSSLQIRIEFKQEPGNGDEISADTYLIQPNGQEVKQIGHAELLGASSDSTFALQQAPDSPATMSLSVADALNSSAGSTPADVDGVGATPSGRRVKEVSAQISNLTFFTGEQTSAPATCRIYAQVASAGQPGQVPVPSPSPSPTPKMAN